MSEAAAAACCCFDPGTRERIEDEGTAWPTSINPPDVRFRILAKSGQTGALGVLGQILPVNIVFLPRENIVGQRR